MEQVAAVFYRWLQTHNVNPDDVQLVVRAKDDRLRHDLISHVKADIKPHMVNADCAVSDLRGLKIHGVGISFGSLDVK